MLMLVPTIGRECVWAVPLLLLATALSLRDDLEGLVTYDARLADAAGGAGLAVFSPS